MINISSLLYIIHSFSINLDSITIQLDELLLWKLVEFFDIKISSLFALLFQTTDMASNCGRSPKFDLNINEYETQRLLTLITSTNAPQIYFNKLYLSSIDLNLSVKCTQDKRSLTPNILSIKRRAPFPLVPFESAEIRLKAYEQANIRNSVDFFLLSIMTHYVKLCSRQIFKIVGSIDFLGNPLGLIHDVTDGLTCLVDQGSVKGLVKNVTHGFANSTSKVAGSLSHGLSKLVSDEDINNRRLSITDHRRNPITLSHAFRQGKADLAAGIFGGLTSIIKQPYKGAVEEGVPGFVKGFAKGIVGTISRPMVGILDFTNEMAIAIKRSSRSPNTILHSRIRPTRCPSNSLGLLQSYSIFDAEGHCLLYKINKGNMNERYISRYVLSTAQSSISDKKLETTFNEQSEVTVEQNNQHIEVS